MVGRLRHEAEAIDEERLLSGPGPGVAQRADAPDLLIVPAVDEGVAGLLSGHMSAGVSASPQGASLAPPGGR